ncbi:phosphocholine cytidylyltransferase family protein [bacterium]|nr:phosphocholine cytidylyltransferase family protein [bacterium]NUN46927.1 phosphocholine cytidylyltransferase family protein [bacterium]
MNITKAVIVAAGLSSRLYPLTLERPKGLLKVNEEELLLRSVKALRAMGIQEIAVVVGYKKEMIMDTLGRDITYIANPFYQQCNNMGSLWFAKNWIAADPIVYLHGDIIYHNDILKLNYTDALQHDCALDLITDFGPVNEEAMKVRVTAEHMLIESNKGIPLHEAAGEWTGIAFIKDPKAALAYMEKIMFEEGLNYYDTHAFTRMAHQGFQIYCSSTRNLPWLEIDFLEDYERAKEIFK